MSPEWFGGRLKELRETAGLTQLQLAEKCGISTRQISRLETGTHEATWSTIMSLCTALGVSCEAFTQPPAERDSPGRGRPQKPDAE